MTPNDNNVGAATVEVDGKSFTFAGTVDTDQAASNRALATSVEVLDDRGPYAPTMATSYFADLRNAARGDAGSVERLRLHAEQRDLTMGTATAGAEFAPPEYLTNVYINAIRSSAPLLNLLTPLPLPAEGVSVVHPKVSSGATVAAQTEGAGLSETDPITASVTVPISTVGGFVDVSTQLLERSQPGIDQVIAADLAAAYFEKLDSLAINGTGSAGQPVGLENATGESVVSYNAGTATFAGVLGAIASAYSAVSIARKQPPNVVLMHPRRWAFLSGQVDTTGRPIISATAAGPNNAGAVAGNDAVAEGEAGRILGMKVVLDSNIKTTGGSGTDEDVIYVLKTDDLVYHAADQPKFEIFPDTLSASLQVRLRIYSYAAFTPNARPEGLARIVGTGLNDTI
jgi:HK97 family phage major capsid protein